MIDKTIYLVRHGETNSNLLQTWRTANEYLTDKGKEQAQLVAERIKKLPISEMVSSTAVRAMETAEIIQQETGLPLKSDALFYEVKSPTSIQGLVHEKTAENKIEQYLQAQLEHAEDSDYRFENEENLYERKERVKKMIAYFDKADDNLLVVTHGDVMKMIMAYIVLGEGCTAKAMHLSSQTFKTANTGITKLIKENGVWRILIWNDHAHFAD